MTTTNRIKFTHKLNGVEGNTPQVLAYSVAEVMAYASQVRNRPGLNQQIWQGRAAYLVNHLFNRNLVSMNSDVNVLVCWLARAIAEGKVATV